MATHSFDNVNLIERLPSYESSIRESRSSFEFSDSGSSVSSSDLPQPPEKDIESRERDSTKTLLHTIMLPVLNILATMALIGVIILIYARADGQSVDYKMGGLSVPTVLALVMTLVVLLIGGGIGYGVSEYKWARFQSKVGKLALLDAYDSCSRGVGGAIRAIPSLRMDMVLITTIIFYLGTIAIGPAAQGILHTRTFENCGKETSDLFPINIADGDYSTYDMLTKDPRSIKGINDYMIVQYGFRQFFMGRPLQLMTVCPRDTINCTYSDVFMPHIATDCTNGSLDTTQILDMYHNNLTNVRNYISNKTISEPSIPAFFYAASMVNRTYYDLNNLTLPYVTSDNPPFSPEARRMIGDQTFVAVTSGDTASGNWDDINELQVRECTLKSFYNRTQLADTQGLINTTVLSSESVDMDYDNIVGNNTFWSQSVHWDDKTNVLLNSYALQISFMRSLILNEQNLKFSMHGWPLKNMLQALGKHVGLVYSITGPVDLTLVSANLTVCRQTDVLYALDQADYFPLALCLLIPLIWWVVTWIVSLYKVNGVSRGHSQVALLVSGLTPAAHDKMRGTIYENQYATMVTASKVNVKFGERVSDGHPTFGLAEEVKPIGELQRRKFNYSV